MQNLISVWNALSLMRRLVVVGATVAVFLAILGLSRIVATPSMALLYAGLDASAAGEVVRALEQRGVAFEVSGDSIRVDASQRDSLRMILASEGLPTTGTAGYELLDGLSGFGTTSQMFDAAYWRAKEGELARTIVSSPTIRSARVHIAQTPAQPFQRDKRPTASVTVTSASGGLADGQAKALRHLIAAAVPGMLPQDVSVIDSVAGLIPATDGPAQPNTVGEAREIELKRNIERLLTARVGPGRAIVEVAIEVETESSSVSERKFDPQGRVAISSDTEERNTATTQANGDVTVASNLPEGDAAGGAQGKTSSTETRERVNFEVSETKREVLRAPGALRRLSVAVLVDGETTTAADGTPSFLPRPAEELAILRELVASAAGIDEARGDVLTLKSLAFMPVVQAGTLAEASLLAGLGPVNALAFVQTAILALVALVLGLFVLRPLLTPGNPRPALAMPDTSLALQGPTSAMIRDTPTGGAFPRVVTGEIADSTLPESRMISVGADKTDDQTAEDPVVRLRRLIEERQADSVEILRGWMESEEEKA